MVGAAGLGAPVGLYLAASASGASAIGSFDVVDFTNLQRQVIHGTKCRQAEARFGRESSRT